MRGFVSGLMAVALLLWAGESHANVLTIDLATGLDTSGNVWSTGDQLDANWTVSGANNYVSSPNSYTVFSNNADWYSGWVANGPNSDWIAADPNVSNNGAMTFTRTFDLTGYNAADATISGGAWTLDDSGQLILNGHLLASIGNGAWGTLNAFSVDPSDFVAGVNTLQIVITSSDNFLEGGRLEGTLTDRVQSAGVPEISTWAMMLLGFGLVGMRVNRRDSTVRAI